MFVLSFKMSKLKIFGVCVAVVAIALISIFTFAGKAQNSKATPVDSKKIGAVVQTNDQRKLFLKSFGWETSAEPTEIIEVIIPNEFNDVYEKYNSIQKEQGYDLAKLKGKRVKRYTYIVTNYPGATTQVKANLIISNDKIVGGDICSVELSGFMHGFKVPEKKTALDLVI